VTCISMLILPPRTPGDNRRWTLARCRVSEFLAELRKHGRFVRSSDNRIVRNRRACFQMPVRTLGTVKGWPQHSPTPPQEELSKCAAQPSVTSSPAAP
jgi:hypothetical protein